MLIPSRSAYLQSANRNLQKRLRATLKDNAQLEEENSQLKDLLRKSAYPTNSVRYNVIGKAKPNNTEISR